MPAGRDVTDRIIRNLFRVQQIGNVATAETSPILDDLFDQIVEDLKKIDPTAPSADRWKTYRVEQFVSEVEKRLRAGIPTWEKAVRTVLAESGRAQAIYAQDMLTVSLGQVGSLVSPTSITQARVRAILHTNPFEGAPLREWAESLEFTTRNRIVRQVRLGMLAEEPIDDIVRRVRGTQAGVLREGGVLRPRFTGGVWHSTTREAQAVVRSGVSYVSSEAWRETWAENARLLKAVEFQATLDDRTCLVAGTRVLTPEGYRPIEEIRPGDVVIGGSRRPRQVRGTRKAIKRDMARVTLSNGHVVECTADHRWLSGSGRWIEARDLVPCESLAYNLDMLHVSRYEEMRDMSVRTHRSPRKGEPVLRPPVLPRGPGARGIQGSSCEVGVVPFLWAFARTNKGPEARRLSRGSPLLLVGLLPGSPPEADSVGVSGLWRGAERHRVVHEDQKVLLSWMPGVVKSSGPSPVSGVQGAIHADPSEAERERGVQEGPHHVLGCMLFHVGPGGRRAEAKDRGGVHGSEAPQLDGWAFGNQQSRPPGARLASDREKGEETGWVSVPELRGQPKGAREGVARSPCRALSELPNSTRGESFREPHNPLHVVSRAGGVGHRRAAGRVGPQDRVTVRSVELYQATTNVYDIHVDVDHSFIVADVVVHNSLICFSLDGERWPADSPDIIVPGRDTHFGGCRSTLVPIPDWAAVGLTPPEEGERLARDLSGLSRDDLARSVAARRRSGDLGGQERVRSSLNAERWLRDQPAAVQDKMLGKGKADLFRAREITLKDLVRSDRSVVPLKDLAA